MRGATSSMYNDHLHCVTMKVWFKNGLMFEESFPIEKTTFADVKYSAIRQYLTNNLSSLNYRRSSFSTIATTRNNLSLDEIENYKLISITTKRIVDEEKTLGQQKVKDGDEYLLATKRTTQSSKAEQNTTSCTVDALLIESRTQDLPKVLRSFNRDYRSAARTEFRTDLNRILITLIETSQKLLWCHPDAENIFKQAEEFLLRSSTSPEESTNPTTISTTNHDTETRRGLISKLVELGFTEQQARIGLKRTRYDLSAAMDLILARPDITDDNNESDQENESPIINKFEIERKPLFSRNGTFISFRKFRQQRFQPNMKAIQSLKEIGFAQDDIVTALRMFNNDKNLACEYLLSDKQQQQNMNDAETEQGLDPNSSIFQSIMQNSIVQRTLNNPKTFFSNLIYFILLIRFSFFPQILLVMLQIAENPTTITNYLSDPEIGNMLLQISRIYHAEKENMNTTTITTTTTTATINNRHDSDQQDENLSRTTGSISGDFDDDSD
ncbi:unnamed protein product [Adineta steineri]|uniref:UBA domain-containing protein n=1 Tax=Adineta steineri TaxID=433720 RepID=A0A818NPD0_9BILA|nr:unnamed protein product [Adineta steineri]CAF3608470.1 unnamed protein product [Adineta steineri]